MRNVVLSAIAAAFCLSPAHADHDPRYWESQYGDGAVTEDIVNPKFPIHTVRFVPQDGSVTAGNLLLRCKNNETEAFYISDRLNFFSALNSPDVKARFGKEEDSNKIKTTMSSDNEAVFISSPIDFIVKIIGSGAVVLSGSYYSANFAALFKVDNIIADRIYVMAEACNWAAKLPPRSDITVAVPDVAASDVASPALNVPEADSIPNGGVVNKDADLNTSLKDLVDKFGLPAVLGALSKLN